uniref:Uncharacterized protein n=1 Tax=Spongospora subterranea TaxID=70186 RepID=A0A0H5R8A2_9EUKA|eukprot:CRZ10360.1 hypothetical protein [Spongospora subterranea]
MPGAAKKRFGPVPIASVVPYTRRENGSVWIMSWKNCLDTRYQSSRFYHDLVVTSDNDDDFMDPFPRISQVLEVSTGAAFGSASKLSKRLRSAKGMLRLSDAGNATDLFLIPVCPAELVSSSIGQGYWINVVDLHSRFAHDLIDCQFGPIELYILFLTRMQAHFDVIVSHLSSLSILPAFPAPSVLSNPTQKPPRVFSDEYFSCKACSRFVFDLSEVAVHDKGSGDCGSIFLSEAVDAWNDALCEAAGKLWCPYCRSRIGSYNWSGSPCSCGEWISPAIQIPKSRVDVKVRRPVLQR